ncbi:aminotransferase class V-fold PLP-dependent enzyme [Paenibacillus glucanolyticus]|jgi:cysteine desulfurase family protein|uniref:aminotransferase class V-fold PLP-dependent enzyme n=1 Tax=Paenibacillus TaxID=44249 RepID=UPI0003E23033|nr:MULTISPECIES: aminotransferase class V-fold PLP-dependent enzyme [Paenibacillus]ANA80175.1 cysteine desulfurase [Paenibacillus glucanolyticus]AVV55758.1 aminotransferase class V-fold PLP-dependent enzyme [Paenibacillus glucanolyticus]ETT38586.1 cysteine desulfurase family protein [Paenibacillus sp. FSL R5-808]MPY19377.1 aminotransferase class V-fold PLP-dependent enzyme [Paenibacillus glucanolyticus]
MDPIVYLDHAATSWPKPPEVFEAMRKAMEDAAANPGRGSHRMAVKASRVLYGTRKTLANIFGVKNPNDIALTSNTTEALNLAIKGYLHEGDHVIATMIEHNSVRRPLEYLKRTRGLQVDYVPVDEEGHLDLRLIEGAFRSNTRLVVCSHSSNLLGSIVPLYELGDIVKRKGAVLLVDAAQSAGMLDINVEDMHIGMLAFPGHKGLLGPQGTGGLYISPNIDLEPLMHGGTGSQSEAIEQPTVRPDRYEAGTPNTVGYAGLQAGVEKVLEWTPQHIYRHEWELTQYMMEGLQEVRDLRLLGPALGKARTGIVAFVSERYSASELSFRLDREYGIAVRAGYHCTPLAHMASGTEKTGAVRASVGISTRRDEIDLMRRAIAEIHS